MADRNILYHIKEMSIAGTMCLSRSNVEQLFTAAIENTTITPSSKAFLHSWQADYLIHTAQDIPMAQSELKKSLAFSPNNTSNLLKLSQLAFLQGEKAGALKILDRIKGMPLLQSERDTMVLLMECLDPNGTVRCTIN